MPSISTLLKTLVVLAPLAAAVPANYPRAQSSSSSKLMPTPTANSGSVQAAAITETAISAGSGATNGTANAASVSSGSETSNSTTSSGASSGSGSGASSGSGSGSSGGSGSVATSGSGSESASGATSSSTTSNGTTSSSTTSNGTASSGSTSNGTASSSTTSNGTASSGTTSNGTASSGTTSSGTTSSGTTSSGTTSSGTTSSGTTSSGTMSSGTTSNGTTSSGSSGGSGRGSSGGSGRGSSGSSGSSTTTTSTKGSGGLTDIDILNFALTAEHLESTFYKMGFAKFSMQDFMTLNLSSAQVKSLMTVAQTEAIHVTTLQTVITAAGAKPVEPCDYNFDAALASPQAMVQTARVLEAVGVSAYLGAAPLVNSSDVLAAAASIVTVEARHQALLRQVNGAEAVPAAFDSALGPRAVFTLAAPFIKSCPQGSNLAIQPFPAIALQNPSQATIGSSLKLADPAQPSSASFCAFVAPGGPQFSAINDGSCVVPSGLAGEVYMMITKSKSVADSEVLAGPSVIQPS